MGGGTEEERKWLSFACVLSVVTVVILHSHTVATWTMIFVGINLVTTSNVITSLLVNS